jgi:hypothetical protein
MGAKYIGGLMKGFLPGLSFNKLNNKKWLTPIKKKAFVELNALLIKPKSKQSKKHAIKSSTIDFASYFIFLE